MPCGGLLIRVPQRLILTREVKAASLARSSRLMGEERSILKHVRAENDVRHDIAASAQDLWPDALWLVELFLWIQQKQRCQAWHYYALSIGRSDASQVSDVRIELSGQLLEWWCPSTESLWGRGSVLVNCTLPFYYDATMPPPDTIWALTGFH